MNAKGTNIVAKSITYTTPEERREIKHPTTAPLSSIRDILARHNRERVSRLSSVMPFEDQGDQGPRELFPERLAFRRVSYRHDT